MKNTNSQAKKTVSTKKPPVASVKKTVTKKTAKKAGRRPDPNLPPSADTINNITNDVLHVMSMLENYTANLRALDRRRHNGVGIKREGFIEAAIRIATNFPQYYPHWLTTQKFNNDLALYNAVKALVEVCKSLQEKAWNINTESADMVYTDALEYYSQVQDAARRRIDPAEALYAELHSFFRRGPMESDEPTKKQTKRDFNAILEGRKDGEVIVRNIKPKKSGGTHQVIDETFKDNASIKETAEGNVKE